MSWQEVTALLGTAVLVLEYLHARARAKDDQTTQLEALTQRVDRLENPAANDTDTQ